MTTVQSLGNMSLKTFNRTDRLYILSPHIDDAIWSLGGLIFELKNTDIEINVITVFSNSSYANGELLDPTVATKIRKAEDRQALKLTRVDRSIYLDYDEAVIRGVPLNHIVDRLYVPTSKMANSIGKDLLRVIPSDSKLIAPGGFGYNIDHLTVRKAVEGIKTSKVYYYEDLPYAARNVRIKSALNFLKRNGYFRIEIPVNQSLIKEHIKLYNVYESQVKPKHVEQIENYIMKNNYGIWTKK